MATKKEKESKSRKRGQESKQSFSLLKGIARVMRGQVITAGFFTRNWLIFFVIVVVLLIYMTNRYNCKTSMERIKSLEEQLDNTRTDALRAKSVYMSKITELSMQERLDSMRLDLRVQDQPPFRIKDGKQQ